VQKKRIKQKIMLEVEHFSVNKIIGAFLRNFHLINAKTLCPEDAHTYRKEKREGRLPSEEKQMYESTFFTYTYRFALLFLQHLI
jgi:hypothetical protein